MGDDRERPSWRDLDKAKDKGSHRKEKTPARQKRRVEGAQKQYRATLDRLFDKGEATKLLKNSSKPTGAKPDKDSRLSLIRAVRDAIGRDEVTKAVDRLLEKGSLPPDEEVLTQAIDHRDEAVARLALEALLDWLKRNQLRRKGTLKARLSGLVTNAFDPETSSLAKEVLDKL